eukprot:1042855-Pelagomonas_calceolata.AAC.1
MLYSASMQAYKLALLAPLLVLTRVSDWVSLAHMTGKILLVYHPHTAVVLLPLLVQEAEARIGPVTIRALGLATQRETTIVWSKVTGLPLCNAIVWLDSRTSEICNRMEEELGGKVGVFMW